MRNNPAFPMQNDDARNAHPDWQGLTKREYIAAALMASHYDPNMNNAKDAAKFAVLGADALIAELSK